MAEEKAGTVDGTEEDFSFLGGGPEVATEMQNVDVHLIGDDNNVTGDLLPKRRKDEEDYWEELTKAERAELEKAEQSQTLDAEGESQAYRPEILEPPLSLTGLITAVEESNALGQDIAAMVTNIDGFGYTFEPTMPLDGEDMRDYVEEELEAQGIEITEESVKRRQEAIRKEAIRERRHLRSFFAFCAPESFIELRSGSREDLESLGNFTWEVLRNDDGNIIQFVQAPFYTMRLAKKTEPIEVNVKRKVGAFTYETTKEWRSFRRFVQRVMNKNVWFKEFGDPRFMSRKTGIYYETEAEIKAATQDDPDDGPATEMLHYKIRSPRGAYGQPRWIGNILSVRGSRLAEEVNFFYFKNKSIPPMIIFVENGRLQSGAVKRLTDFMNQIKGDTEKFWRIAVIEGESADSARQRGSSWSGNARFRVQKLFNDLPQDALFQGYDERNRDKVGESFRLPRLLRGDVRDFNRATAETAKAFAEEQVFQPERDRFDAWVNRVLGPELDMKFWRFKSNSSVVRDPVLLTDMTEKLIRANVLTPKEGRQIAEDIFNRAFADIEEEWVKQPMPLTLAVAKTPQGAMRLDELMQTTKEGGELDLGNLGDDIQLIPTVKRLGEIRDALANAAIVPTDEGEDREVP